MTIFASIQLREIQNTKLRFLVDLLCKKKL